MPTDIRQFCLIWLFRFRDSLEFDTVVVHAIQSSHQISTYRLLAMSEKYYQDKERPSWKRTVLKQAWKQAEEREIITETRRTHRANDDHLNLTSNVVSVFHLSLFS